MPKTPRKTSVKKTATRTTNSEAGSIQATTVHEGARYYARQLRTSEVLGNNNQDPRNIITDFDRWNLVNKARFFVENIPAIKGAVEEIATYSVGQAWVPVYQGENEAWGKVASQWLNRWLDFNCDVWGNDMDTNLWLASLAVDRDGDVLMNLTYAEDGQYPQVQLIPTHRVTTTSKTVESGPFVGCNVFDGVILNGANRPIGYNVVLQDSGSNAFTGPSVQNKGPSIQLSLKDAHLVYESRYPLQLRGFPSLATSILDWQDYRDIKDFEREAIKQAAAIALIEKNEVGGALPGQFLFSQTSSVSMPNVDSNHPLFYKPYMGGMIRYFASQDPNASIEQMKNDRPGDLTQTFIRDHLLRPAFNSIGWPLEMAYDMGGMNSANTRAILSKVERKLAQRQATLFKMFRRAIIYALAKAIKLKLIPFAEDWYKWTATMPKSPSIDLGRDTKSDIDLLKVCGTTLTDIHGKAGENFEDKARLRIKEVKFLMEESAKEKVPWELVYNTITPGGLTPKETSEEPKDNEKEK